MKKLILLIITSSLLISCVKENNGNVTIEKDNFNRSLILSNWVQNIVLPAYEDFKIKLTDLKSKEQNFTANPNTATLTELQDALFQAQLVWQHVAMFDLHRNSSEKASYRLFMNTYPIDNETSIGNSNEDDATLIDHLENGDASNIELDRSNAIDEQGFPAIDYLINGVALSKYTTDPKKENYKVYLTKVVDRMVSLTNNVVSYWNNNASAIIANNGSSATASFDLMLNDYINYVEQGFRESKIATPSGKRSGNEFKNELAVESYYSADHSKALFDEAYKAVKNLYYGISYDGTKTGTSIDAYLKYLNAEFFNTSDKKDYKIADYIDTKFADIEAVTQDLDDNFVTQINTDNTKLFTTFNVIQEYVVLIKTNTFQALNVRIDYVDADGD